MKRENDKITGMSFNLYGDAPNVLIHFSRSESYAFTLTKAFAKDIRKAFVEVADMSTDFDRPHSMYKVFGTHS